MYLASGAHSSTLLINQESPYFGYGYGLAYWNTFTADINSAFGGSGNVTVYSSDLNSLAYMLNFSSLMVDVRQSFMQPTATEISNITAYEATGRRVLLIGENWDWRFWDNAILSRVGGGFSDETSYAFETLDRVVIDSITADSPTLITNGDGIAWGGLSLYSKNVVTQWGAGNVMSLLSANVQDDFTGNGAFTNNLAIWLAGGSTPVPEPGTLVMLGAGILGLGGMLRRKYRKLIL